MGLGPIFCTRSSWKCLSRKAQKDRLIELLEPPVKALGYELVDLDVSVGGRGLLRIYIDHSEGVGLADCELVSRQLSAFLDVEDPLPGSYVLEVSSPGLDRPLRTLQHFKRFTDEEVKIELKEVRSGRRKLKGYLRGVEADEVIVEVNGETWRLRLPEIATAQLVPSY